MRHASTRSEKCASQPWSTPRAQCSVGSIELDGIRYGLITHCLIASTIRIAPTIVTSQSIVIRQLFGRPDVRRSTGLRERRGGAAGASGDEGSSPTVAAAAAKGIA